MNIAFVSTAHLHVDMYFQRLRMLLDGQSAYAIWDDNEERGRMAASKERAKYYATLEEMLKDPAIDGFVICSENMKTLCLLERVFPVGKPILCEKPLVVGLKQLDDLKRLISGDSKRVVSAYFQSYLGGVASVANLLKSGELGRVESIRYRNTRPVVEERWFDQPGLKWFVNPSLSGGGGFLDLGCHAVHCLCSVFGPIRRVRARIGNESGVYAQVDDYGEATLEFVSGEFAEVEAGWLGKSGEDGFEIIGERGNVWNSSRGYVAGSSKESAQCLEVLPDQPIRIDRLLAAIRGELSKVDCIKDMNCCFDTVRGMEAAYRSARTGRWISIS